MSSPHPHCTFLVLNNSWFRTQWLDGPGPPEHNTSVSSFREYRAPRWLIEPLGDKTHGQPHVRTLHPPRRGPRSWRTRFSCFGGPFRCSNNCDTNEHAARCSRDISPIELGCKHLYLKLTRFTDDDFTPRRRPSTTSAGASLQPRSHSSLPSRPDFAIFCQTMAFASSIPYA